MIYSFIKKIDPLDRYLYLICFISALTFELSQLLDFTYNFSSFLKSVPLLSLIVLVFRHTNKSNRLLLILGLLFGMTGDVLLDMNRETNFMFALIVYLIGHLLYISVFHRRIKYNKKHIIPTILVLIATIIIGYFLRNIPQKLLIPVIVYLVVIALMVVSSFMVNYGNWLIWSGAIIFMISDTIIAVNKFLIPIPKSTFFNIGLYYLAQIFLISGLIICLNIKFQSEKKLSI